MTLQFRAVPAEKCPPRDVNAALDIYVHTVDIGSMTDTNQIKDYIWNPKKHKKESRKMFFYIFYGNDGAVQGFSEFAYLPKSNVLVLDYLCTRQKNHMLFYNFYHMALQDIEDKLRAKGEFVRFIITELSLRKIDEKLIDHDSNFFRHLLSNESYQLLKYPYYQPPLLPDEMPTEFNLSIKLLSAEAERSFILEKEQYLQIVHELYFAHYLDWHQNFEKGRHPEEKIKELFARIKQEIPQDKESEIIDLIQCKLYEDGQCPKFTAENITIPRLKKQKWRKRIVLCACVLFALLTFLVCIIPLFSKISTTMCSFLTIVAGIITAVSYRKELFGSQ